ncbi:MAG: UDP-N-acetylmuramate--L-alanine ligase [Treponema sp.]|nr:UDP-N-acetylmuramate--L-alanine ligase [Spirochaetia bacterium]MDY2840993.1 UDP-N-acetylmuramate--L-alanine ligase [Treponema sp.]MDY5123966.1 UDP-N-acetylmuramate--L-alanine ligase [Treponema sp.]
MNTEKSLPENFKGVHIHFVGIKGTGMAAFVEILFHNGAIITGSDVSERFYTDEIIEKLGLKALPFSSENITDDIQYVIYSSAYKLDKNPDLIEAVKKNIPCLLYTEALGSYSSKAYSCGICGVHGKTSTTGLTGTILKEIDLPAQTLAGSIINSFGNTCTFTSPLIKTDKTDSNIFVAETCEYQRHFMSFCPKKIILTSVEPDHQDYYPTYEDIRSAFVDYICKLPENGELIYCADDKGAVETALIAKEKRNDINLIPYGVNADGEYKLNFTKVENELNQFTINNYNFAIGMPGKHEVLDACAAVALVCQLLKSFDKNPSDYYEKIAIGLMNFTGGKRRSEIIARKLSSGGNDVVILDDYGHHPTAIKTTLEGYREFYKGRKIIVDFMSHTYSRTEALLKEFASAFDSADEIILHKIYSSARENPADFKITGKTLYEETVKHVKEIGKSEKNVHYFEEVLDAKKYVEDLLNEPLSSQYPDGYLFVTMGAGDNWKLGKEV